MRNRPVDLIWVPLLLLSAGLSLVVALTFDGEGWLAVPMAVLAYLAGLRMASLSLALWVFAAVTVTGLVLGFWRSPDPLSPWLSVVFVEFAASVLPWWAGRYQRLSAEQRERERGAAAEEARLHERARIAQDMHDSLGHELALIALHSGALELTAGLNDKQRQAASDVRAGAVRATQRLHEIVQVLGSADAAAALRPADESIDVLVRRATAAGLRVRLTGEVPIWSPIVSQAAHRVVRNYRDAGISAAQARQRVETLTERERDVLALLGAGHSNAEIARTLYIVEGTVKAHVSSILDKLRARNRVQAAILAYEAGVT
ncbi:DNA-binding NarL/FixJ family response regulator [Kibdelosporangium banguiense]|uniref:DNA-binding NarL/FixJ family response regulator n=1 Tax=Kibdelosporangium banguiense TaxID=1365924 RepID=A0ABS4TTK9_9PSEU|nr:DNA-binding NarL/FixJ family response regulator [Kibdelosporangium banguiense]